MHDGPCATVHARELRRHSISRRRVVRRQLGRFVVLGIVGIPSKVHIPGSHHLSRALLLSSELPDQDLVLIAEDDQRAGELGEALHQRGFHRQIRSLHGGLPAWTQAGHPLQQAPATNTKADLAPLAAALLVSLILALQHAPLLLLAAPWAVVLLAPRLQALRSGRGEEIARQRVA